MLPKYTFLVVWGSPGLALTKGQTQPCGPRAPVSARPPGAFGKAPTEVNVTSGRMGRAKQRLTRSSAWEDSPGSGDGPSLRHTSTHPHKGESFR